MSESKVAKLQAMAPDLEKNATTAGNPTDSKRLQALADILKHPAA